MLWSLGLVYIGFGVGVGFPYSTGCAIPSGSRLDIGLLGSGFMSG